MSKKKSVSPKEAAREKKECAAVAVVASKASSLADPLSDIRNTNYWACKPKMEAGA